MSGKVFIVAGTRTAPAVDGTPNQLALSIRMIDSDGTKRALDYALDLAAANADIEAVIATLQLATNASIYEVVVGQVYTSNAASTSAATAVQQSARQNIVILFKNSSTFATQEVYIPAPLSTLFVTGTKNVDITETLYTDYRDAVDVVLPTAYAPISVRYTERRQINQKQNTA